MFGFFLFMDRSAWVGQALGLRGAPSPAFFSRDM